MIHFSMNRGNSPVNGGKGSMNEKRLAQTGRKLDFPIV